MVFEQVFPPVQRPHLPAGQALDNGLGVEAEVGRARGCAGLEDEDVLGPLGTDLEDTDLVVGRRAGTTTARDGDDSLSGLAREPA